MEGARPAHPDDIEHVVKLAEQLRDELVPMRGGELWAATLAASEPLADHYAAAAAGPDSALVVGTIDDVVVGYGTARIDVLRDGTRLAVIAEVFVEVEARAVGVGEALLDALCTWCDAQRCDGIDAVALPGHRAAKNFFEAHGFTARLLTMHAKRR